MKLTKNRQYWPIELFNKEIFEKFNKAVKNNQYAKLEYNKWRTIREWLNGKNYKQLYTECTTDAKSGAQCWAIGPYDQIKCVPLPIIVAEDDETFGSFLTSQWVRESILPDMSLTYSNNSITSDDLITNTITVDSLNYLKDSYYWGGTIDTSSAIATIDYVDKKINEIIKKEENKEMKFGNFDFGPVGPSIRMSAYGLAIKNASGTYVSYDAANNSIMDVDVLNFDGSKFLYKMPVAIKDITVGDIIVHQNVPMFVVAIPANGICISAVDPVAGERKDIMLTKSPFGFNFATKVVNFLGNLGGTASNDNPFGNLGLMLMLGDNKGMDNLLPLMLMGNGNLDMSNPMMMYALMSQNGSKNDLLPLMFMMNAQKPAHECKCGGNCGGCENSN